MNDVAAPPDGLYRNIWHFAAGVRAPLVLAMVLLLASQVVKLAVPWLAAQAIDALQRNEADSVLHAARYVVLVVLTFVAAWALHGPGRLLERGVGLRIRQAHADALYAKLMRLPMAWHDRHHSGDVQQRSAQSTAALSGFAQSQFVYLQSAVNLVGPMVALCAFSARLGAMAVTGYLLVGCAILRFDRTLMRLAAHENAAERRYQAGLLDFLGNVSTVLSLRLRDNTRRLLAERLSAVFVPVRRSIALNEAKWCSVDLLSVALTWTLVATFVWLDGRAGGVVLLGSVYMVYQYAQQASGVIGTLAGTFQGYARTRTDFASVAPIWSAPEQLPCGPALSAHWRRIDVHDLCFEHPRSDACGRSVDAPDADGQATTGLRRVALSLERGDRIALVGASGSGKSTLMRVLAGLYVPNECRIEVDRVPTLGTRDLGSISTLIPQEADVFEATVRENIAFSGGAIDAAVLEAIHTSAFDNVLSELPLGLDTPLAERGFNLSGGQRQRLCLARGILAARSSSLVLLDEPTSALDPVTEEVVFARLSELFASACIVASVHRMSVLHHFNKVVLMEAGRVVDVGSAHELMERQNGFRRMVSRTEGRPERRAA